MSASVHPPRTLSPTGLPGALEVAFLLDVGDTSHLAAAEGLLTY